jgi:Uma2 family endonuclease
MLLYFRDRAGFGMALTDVEMALAPDCRVRPDVVFLLGGRANSLDIFESSDPGAPDLAVEIIAPSERSAEIRKNWKAIFAMEPGGIWQVTPNPGR